MKFVIFTFSETYLANQLFIDCRLLENIFKWCRCWLLKIIWVYVDIVVVIYRYEYCMFWMRFPILQILFVMNITWSCNFRTGAVTTDGSIPTDSRTLINVFKTTTNVSSILAAPAEQGSVDALVYLIIGFTLAIVLCIIAFVIWRRKMLMSGCKNKTGQFKYE